MSNRDPKPPFRKGGKSFEKGRKSPPSTSRPAWRDRDSGDGPAILYGWHTVSAALANPRRRILKLLLTEVYASEYPNSQSLSQRFKQAIYSGSLDIDELDPYVMIYRRLEHYLLERGEFTQIVERRNDEFGQLIEVINSMGEGLVRKGQVENILHQFLDRGVVDKLLAEIEPVHVGGEKVQATVLFADIVGFTTLSESMTPEAVSRFLSEYFHYLDVCARFYFGSVEHYRLIAQSERVIIDVGEHYERQSYRTRTSIIGPNGRDDLVVQIERRSGEKMPMHTVRLSHSETWPQQHLHAIRTAYGKTPWFIHYIDDIEATVLRKYERLIDLDLATMRLALKWLGLAAEMVISRPGDGSVPSSFLSGTT